MNSEEKAFGSHLFDKSGKQVDDSSPVFVSADQYNRILNAIPPALRFASMRLIEKGVINVFAYGKCYAIGLDMPVDMARDFVST